MLHVQKTIHDLINYNCISFIGSVQQKKKKGQVRLKIESGEKRTVEKMVERSTKVLDIKIQRAKLLKINKFIKKFNQKS